MVRKSKFIGTTETGQLSALGNNQQREFEFIRNLINEDSVLKYFAEPSIHENQEKIDWYSEADGNVKKFQDFTDNEITQAKSEFNDLMDKLKVKSLAAKSDIDRETILNLTMLPDQDSIKKVGDQFVIINWAYKLHKRESTNGTFANFAGFAENEAPNILNTDEDKTSDAQDIVQPSSKILEPQVPTEKAPVQKTYSSNTEEPIKETDLRPERAINPLITNTWFWLVFFLIFLLLNVLMLKDACGVKSVPFLYFC
jgi:hypothetical protein